MKKLPRLAGITSREGQIEKEYRWGDPITHRVPDLTGMTKGKITSQLYTYRIEWHGSGEQVKYQLPVAETLITVDDVIHVYTE